MCHIRGMRRSDICLYLGPADRTELEALITSQLEGFVAKLVETGRYNSKSEVLREGVRLFQ